MTAFNLSDYLASAALVASAISALYAKRQSEWAKISSTNDYRTQLSEQHARYRLVLAEVRRRHKPDLSQLSESAASALTKIINRADDLDNRIEGSCAHLRHVLHECSEMAFYAFRGQLAWQTGLNITWRISHLTSVEDNLEPDTDYFSKGDAQASFRRRYWEDPNAMLETDLKHDRRFCNLVSQLKSRINPESRIDFLVGIQEDLAAFRTTHETSRAGFCQSVEQLDEMLEEGKIEHFPLEESPQLYNAIQRQKTVLDTLSNLSIPLIELEDAVHYRNYVSIAVHACTVLHAISRVHSWGWDRT
ncbi:conserved hypothetical protein [Burkholderia diffusa]|nr:conserved hypothetical protein [Burkholderia diffusa]